MKEELVSMHNLSTVENFSAENNIVNASNVRIFG